MKIKNVNKQRIFGGIIASVLISVMMFAKGINQSSVSSKISEGKDKSSAFMASIFENNSNPEVIKSSSSKEFKIEGKNKEKGVNNG